MKHNYSKKSIGCISNPIAIGSDSYRIRINCQEVGGGDTAHGTLPRLVSSPTGENLKYFLSLVLTLINCLFLLLTCNGQKASKKPNVLILCADEWRAQSTGYSGDKNVKTPHLDQLAASSANFVNAVSGIPVCTPFRASLMTGQRPLTNGIFMNDVRLDTNAITLAKVFKKNGYNTGYIGKWHLDGQYRLSYTPPGNRRQGFEYWKAVNCDHNYNHSVYYDNDDTTRRYWEGYDVFSETKDAENYIRDHANKAQPFLLMLSWGTPHSPYHTAPEKYRKLYDSSKIILRPNVPDSMAAKVRYDLVGYYSHITAIDDMIGQVMETLKREGILDNTIVLFISDHGDLLGSHEAYYKQRPYDESIRVPMLFHYQGKNGKIKNGKYPAMANAEDIMPTLLGLSGIKIPSTVEGVDFSKYMRGNQNDPKDSVAILTCIQPFGQWPRSEGGKEYRGIRTPSYTYVRDLKGPWLLYDNINDPYQLNNLVNKKEFSKLQSRLNSLLMKKLKETNDEFLPGLTYVKKYNYPALDKTETVPYNYGPHSWPFSYLHKIADTSSDMSYLDNGVIKIGVNLSAGGAITYLADADSQRNLINNYDYGRQVQMSFYSGPIPFVPNSKEPFPRWRGLGWNPIQTGDIARNGSKIVNYSNNGKEIYVKAIPMQWPLDNEPCECFFETWIHLENNTAQVKSRLINQRKDTTQYIARRQELPAVYTNANLGRLITYRGDKPFTHDTTSVIENSNSHGPGIRWSRWQATENWAAHLNNKDWGLGVWAPGIQEFGGGFVGRRNPLATEADAATGYISPNRREILDHNIIYTYQYALIVGNLSSIRAYVYLHSKRQKLPGYEFKNDRSHWYYQNTKDKGWPISGYLDIPLMKGSAMIGPTEFWEAEKEDHLRITAAYNTTAKKVVVFWKAFGEDEFVESKSVKFDIISDGNFHQYNVKLSDNPNYKGALIGLKMILAEGDVSPDDWAKIKSINLTRH